MLVLHFTACVLLFGPPGSKLDKIHKIDGCQQCLYPCQSAICMDNYPGSMPTLPPLFLWNPHPEFIAPVCLLFQMVGCPLQPHVEILLCKSPAKSRDRTLQSILFCSQLYKVLGRIYKYPVSICCTYGAVSSHGLGISLVAVNSCFAAPSKQHLSWEESGHNIFSLSTYALLYHITHYMFFLERCCR